MNPRLPRWLNLLLASGLLLAAAASPVPVTSPRVQAASPAALQASLKLSGLLPPFGDVKFIKLSPDGRYAAFTADLQTDEAFELYSVPLTGGSPVRLSGSLPSGYDVYAFEFTPDSSRVVYRAPQDNTAAGELYSVPVTGPAGAGVKLNAALIPNGEVQWFEISPDGSRVVYYADQIVDNRFEIFSVPVAGPASEAVVLNQPLPPGGKVWWFLISPDSSRVAYSADQDTAGLIEMYSVPLAGPAASGVKLNPPPPLVGGGNSLLDFAISPDSSRVVFITDHAVNNLYELYSAPLTGPAAQAVKLNGPVVVGGDVNKFAISSDSSQVVYLADQEVDTRMELYSVPIDGPAAEGVKLNGVLVPGGIVINFQISPDSSRVIYRADQVVDDQAELFSVPLTGPASAAEKLNRPLVNIGMDVESGFQVSPDSSRVIYLADQDTNDVQEIYSVPLGGPATEGVKLNRPLTLGGHVGGFRLAPNSRYVVYYADLQVNDQFELFHSPLTGWDAPPPDDGKVNSPFVPLGDVPFTSSYLITSTSGRVVYSADQDTDDMFELYVADLGVATLGFTEVAALVPETQGSFTFTVLLSADRIAPVEVAYAVTGGSATPGEDFSLPPGTLTFQPGDLMQSFSLSLLDDNAVEEEETVVVTLSSPSGAGLSGMTSFTLTIISDDILPPPPALYLTHLPLMQR